MKKTLVPALILISFAIPFSVHSASLQEQYSKSIAQWKSSNWKNQKKILESVSKLLEKRSDQSETVVSALPKEISRMKLVLRRHSFPASGKIVIFSRFVCFFNGKQNVESFSLIKYPNTKILDKNTGVGTFNMLSGGEGFSANITDEKNPVPTPGLYALTLKFKNKPEFHAEFFVLEKPPTEALEMLNPTVDKPVLSRNPVIEWKTFSPKDTRSYYRREIFIALEKPGASFKDKADWSRLFEQPFQADKQIRSIQIRKESNKDKISERGLVPGKSYILILTQLEENILSPEFFISRESTIELPVTVQ